MANITKEGLVPDKRPHATVCRICGSEFTFMEGEAAEVQGWPKHLLMQIPCPQDGCGVSVYHYSAYFPLRRS